ncbi:MAG TPA: OmpH family outer membrane protein [Anseongella sp.]|nr:OmpH family outer membrane protein [Anseongella sp.]
MTRLSLPVLLISIVLSLGALFYAYRANQQAPKIGYVNSARLVGEYQGTKAVQETFKQKSGAWQSNIDTLQQEFDRQQQQFARDRAGMSAKESSLAEQLLGSKQQQLAQYQQAIAQKAQEEDDKLKQQIFTEIDAYVKHYGEEHGYAYILGATNAGNIVYARKTTDLTEEILQGLNAGYASTQNQPAKP